MPAPILAVIPYTGSEKLVQMTDKMVGQLLPTLIGADVSQVVLVANKPSRLLEPEKRMRHLKDAIVELKVPENRGFGPGINYALGASWKGDVLVLNNDLSFPQREWLNLLRAEQAEDEKDNLSYVYAPRTNCTATPEACKDGPEDKPAQRVRQVSAFCWLVPAKIRKLLRERGGFELFPPQFPNYGSDDAAAAWIRFLFGKTPFKVVHRAFVQHAKGRTAAETGDRPGDPGVLKRLRAYIRQHQLPP